MKEDWLTIAAKITNEYSLAAYTIAALLTGLSVIGRQKLKAKPWLLGLVVLAIVCIASIPMFSKIILARMQQPYRISVIVVAPDGTRAPHSTVSASVPYSSYQIQDVPQVEIDESHVPADRMVTVSAKDDVLFEEESADVKLLSDRTPALTALLKEAPGEVRGNVFNSNKQGLVGVRVSVEGYSESDTSKESGVFLIHTHAPNGAQVTLLAEKPGFRSARQQHIVGRVATITLEPIRGKLSR